MRQVPQDVPVWRANHGHLFEVVFDCEFPVCNALQRSRVFFDVAFVEGHCSSVIRISSALNFGGSSGEVLGEKLSAGFHNVFYAAFDCGSLELAARVKQRDYVCGRDKSAFIVKHLDAQRLFQFGFCVLEEVYGCGAWQRINDFQAWRPQSFLDGLQGNRAYAAKFDVARVYGWL